MNRYFISDLHLDESKPETTALFQTFIKQTIRENVNGTELYILGDLFESWIGDDYENPFHNDIKLLLASMSNSGINIFSYLVIVIFSLETHFYQKQVSNYSMILPY